MHFFSGHFFSSPYAQASQSQVRLGAGDFVSFMWSNYVRHQTPDTCLCAGLDTCLCCHQPPPDQNKITNITAQIIYQSTLETQAAITHIRHHVVRNQLWPHLPTNHPLTTHPPPTPPNHDIGLKTPSVIPFWNRLTKWSSFLQEKVNVFAWFEIFFSKSCMYMSLSEYAICYTYFWKYT